MLYVLLLITNVGAVAITYPSAESCQTAREVVTNAWLASKGSICIPASDRSTIHMGRP